MSETPPEMGLDTQTGLDAPIPENNDPAVTGIWPHPYSGALAVPPWYIDERTEG